MLSTSALSTGLMCRIHKKDQLVWKGTGSVGTWKICNVLIKQTYFKHWKRLLKFDEMAANVADQQTFFYCKICQAQRCRNIGHKQIFEI